MRAAILAVGTELLFGQTINTNAAYLSRELQNIGIDVMYHYTVGDNPKRLKELLNLAYRDVDLVITTGGLGPTQDDLTKEVVCEYFGEPLVEYKGYTKALEEHFKKAGYKWTDNNRKQAYFPLNSTILDNDIGTAPGIYLEKGGKAVATLPGPPREMTRMFQFKLKPILLKDSNDFIYYRILRTFGIGESSLETVLMPLIDKQTDPTIATYAKEGETSIRITSKRKSLEEAKAEVDSMIFKVNQIIGAHVYSYDDESLAEVVGKLLMKKNISIACCESCTGGLLAAALTEIPGISKVFNRGLVTYTYGAKEEELNVRPETLLKFTAESGEVCREMVEGLKGKTNCDFCISITGIAGPEDLSPEKPAGLAYIGIAYNGKTEIIEFKHRNVSRKWNRNYMLLNMLYEIYIRVK